jgi:hypothetical protein
LLPRTPPIRPRRGSFAPAHPPTRAPAHPRTRPLAREVRLARPSIDAARRVGDQIAESIAAQAAVEQLLREERPALEPGDDDSDTPVGGVTAASL